MGFTESSTIQAAIRDRATRADLGWRHVPGKALDREDISPLIEREVIDALLRLNPLVAAKPERVDEILPKLRAVILSVTDEGLVAANERMTRWLRGFESHQFVGTDKTVPIRLIDFDDPRSNSLIVSDEVTFKAGLEENRFDNVFFVNGFPLVVGEDKTPVNLKRSWLNAARDITQTYEVETPGFFVPNVLNFATEGKDFRYGPIGLPAEKWLPWGKSDEEYPVYGMKRALRGFELLVAPEAVLSMLRHFTLYSTERIGKSAKAIKVIARYPQVEGVEAAVARAADMKRSQGLLWQHQGSGKTFLMAFACGKLRREIPGSTVLVVLHRLDLIEQTTREFSSAGVERVRLAETRQELQAMLASGQRGVIITTIFRFKGAEELTDRADIIVLVDEAHHSQEGSLGMDMRRALPRATYIGLTGTPISDRDRDTFENFGDPDDPDNVLARYPPERSIEDGATLPLRVEAPKPDLQLDKKALDSAFDEMANEEGLTEEEKEVLARKASRVATLFHADARVEAICDDIVDHFHARMEPLGLKAQVVVFDRALCVRYLEAIQRRLDERGAGDQATVVMTVSDKDDPREWRQFDRSRAAEAKIKAQFRDPEDPLKFLIVTAKLLTGFDAPIEGVMYLDKPLRKHTLFQALARTNRPWRNPETGQEKTWGLIVDYVGLGKEIAESMQTKRAGEGQGDLDVEPLKRELRDALGECLDRFRGIDTADASFRGLMEAQDRLATDEEREAFARGFLKVEGLFEFLWPAEDLREIRDPYRWLAKVYESIQPPETSDALLWHRLGAKTLELINEHIVKVEVRGSGVEDVILDEDTLRALRELGVESVDGGEPLPPTPDDILDSIEERIRRRLDEKDNPRYRSIAERLDKLREAQIAGAADSIEFLKRLLEVARDVVAADREDEAAEAEDGSRLGLLPEERIGALTQIFEEYKPDASPEIIERIVKEIDQVVGQARFMNWQGSREGTREVRKAIRQALDKFDLAREQELFDRAYAYVEQHY